MFKIGDRVKCLITGNIGEIISFEKNSYHPINIIFKDKKTYHQYDQSYTYDGRENFYHMYHSIIPFNEAEQKEVGNTNHVDKDNQKPLQNTSTLELSFPNLYKEVLKNELEFVGGAQATDLWKRYINEELTLKELGENLLKLSELESKIREELEKMEG